MPFLNHSKSDNAINLVVLSASDRAHLLFRLLMQLVFLCLLSHVMFCRPPLDMIFFWLIDNLMEDAEGLGDLEGRASTLVKAMIIITVDSESFEKRSITRYIPSSKSHDNIISLVGEPVTQNNRDNNVDRATSALTNRCSTVAQIKLISQTFINNPEQSFKYFFRNKLAFLLSHFLLLRGEPIRNLEFSDPQYSSLSNAGTEGTYPAILVDGPRPRNHQVKKAKNKGKMPNRDSSPLEGEYDYESSSDEEDQEESVFKILAETAISKTAHTRFMKNAFAGADLFVKN
ncbi:hypothetical protein [Parasitella parasitica]|uniref:Uncharacterized protein n=1 Tax=Parasitella parasitica TaxID=35722 RepID=A0A0B7MZS1_9FUNG|nr:hypothetical protein [Parasitella parasitica]